MRFCNFLNRKNKTRPRKKINRIVTFLIAGFAGMTMLGTQITDNG